MVSAKMRDAGRKAKPGPQSDPGCPALLATRARLIETCSSEIQDYDNAPRRQLRFEAYFRYEDAALKAC